MNMHPTLPPHETGPPGHTTSPETANITLLGNLAAAGNVKSLQQLQLLAHSGIAAARRELASITHLLPKPKDNKHAKCLK